MYMNSIQRIRNQQADLKVVRVFHLDFSLQRFTRLHVGAWQQAAWLHKAGSWQQPLRGYCDTPTWQDHFGSLVELASLAQSKRQGVKRWKRGDRCFTSKSRVLFKVTLDDLWRMPLMRTAKEYHDVVCVLCHYHSVLSTCILKASKLWQNMVEPSKVCHFITLLCTLHCFWMEVDHLECSTVEHAWFSMSPLLL